MQEETADADGWQTEYSDRFAYKRRRGDDTIKVKQPQDGVPGGRDEFEVVARIDGEVYHSTHVREIEAMERVAVLEELAQYNVSFEQGDEVFVVDDGFEPVVQRGYIGHDPDEYRSVPVFVPTDPYDSGVDEGRVIRVQADQLLHADAGAIELLLFIGRIDLIEPEDL